MKLSQSFVVASLSMAQVGLSAPIPDSPDPSLLSPRPSDNHIARSPRMNAKSFGRRSISPIALEARNNELLKAAVSVGGGGGGDDGDQPPRQPHHRHTPKPKPKPEHKPKPKKPSHPHPPKSAPQHDDDNEGSQANLQSDTRLRSGDGVRSQTAFRAGDNGGGYNGGGSSGGGGGGGGGLLDMALNLNIRRASVLRRRDISEILSGLSQSDLSLLETEIAQLTQLSSSPQAAPGGQNKGSQASSPLAPSSLINNVEQPVTQVISGLPILGGALSSTMQSLHLDGAGQLLNGNLVNGLTQPLASLPVVGGPVATLLGQAGLGTAPGTTSQNTQSNSPDSNPIGRILASMSSTVSGLPVVGGPLSGVVGGLPLDSLTKGGNPVSNVMDTATGAIAGLPVVGGPLSSAVGSLPLQGLTKGASPISNIMTTVSGAVSGLPVVGAPVSGALNSLPLDALTKGSAIAGLTSTATSAVSGLPVVGGPLSGVMGSLPIDSLTKGGLVAGTTATVSGAVSGLPVAGGPLAGALSSLPLDTVSKALPLSLMAVPPGNESPSRPGYAFNAVPIPDDPASILAAAGGALPIQPSNSLDGMTIPNYFGGQNQTSVPDSVHNPVMGGQVSLTDQSQQPGATHPYVTSAEENMGEKKIDLAALQARHAVKAVAPLPSSSTPAAAPLYQEAQSKNATIPSISITNPNFSKTDSTISADADSGVVHEIATQPEPDYDSNPPKIHSLLMVSNSESTNAPSSLKTTGTFTKALDGTTNMIAPEDDDDSEAPKSSAQSNPKPTPTSNSNQASDPSPSSSPSASSSKADSSGGPSSTPTTTNTSSSSSAPPSKASGDSQSPFSGIYAPAYDPSFGLLGGKSPMAGGGFRAVIAGGPDPTAGSGQAAASTAPALSPIFETEEEHVTPPAPLHTPNPKIDPAHPSTNAAYQIERESGSVARRWYTRRQIKLSPDRQGRVRRLLNKVSSLTKR